MLIAVLGSVIVATGCGDDGDPAAAGGNADADAIETTPGEGFSKAEFVDQANAVCARRSAEVKVEGQRLFKKIFNEPEAIAAKKMANQVIIPGFEGELEDLQALNVPTGDGDQVSAIYTAIEEMVERLKADPSAANFYPYTKAEDLAAQYGLTACGHP